jgi:hypothetical protein
MNLLARGRWPVMLTLLAVAAWLAFFGDKTPASLATAVPRPSMPVAASPARPQSRSTAAAGPRDALPGLAALVARDQLIASPSTGRAGRDLFAAVQWTPPPAPAPAPAAAQTAPAPAYVYVGKKREGGQWEVYLSRGDQNFIVREGGALEGAYRVAKIEPPTLTISSLSESQTLTIDIGGAE